MPPTLRNSDLDCRAARLLSWPRKRKRDGKKPAIKSQPRKPERKHGFLLFSWILCGYSQRSWAARGRRGCTELCPAAGLCQRLPGSRRSVPPRGPCAPASYRSPTSAPAASLPSCLCFLPRLVWDEGKQNNPSRTRSRGCSQTLRAAWSKQGQATSQLITLHIGDVPKSA